MKRIVYLSSATLAAALLGLVLYGLLEMVAIRLLLVDFERYGLGMTWGQWEAARFIAVPLIIAGFAWGGMRAGRRWWQILYVEQRYRRFLRKPLKPNF